MFGWFGKKSDGATIDKHAQRLANKRAQAPDRWDSIQALSALLKDAQREKDSARIEAIVAALLPRFAYVTDPTITDQEEKDYAFRVALEAGVEGVPAIRRYMEKCESLSWPLRLLDRVVAPESVTGELITLLESMGTDYERDPQRKLQVLQALEERRDVRIAPAIVRFLDDSNETARLHATAAILSQENAAEQREALVKALLGEESLRVKARASEGFASLGWEVPERPVSKSPTSIPRR